MIVTAIKRNRGSLVKVTRRTLKLRKNLVFRRLFTNKFVWLIFLKIYEIYANTVHIFYNNLKDDSNNNKIIISQYFVRTQLKK